MLSPLTPQKGPSSLLLLSLRPFLSSPFWWTVFLCLSFHYCCVHQEFIPPLLFLLYVHVLILSHRVNYYLYFDDSQIFPQCWPFLQSSMPPIKLPNANKLLHFMFHGSLQNNITKTKISLPQTVSSFCLTWKYYHHTQRKNLGPPHRQLPLTKLLVLILKYFSMCTFFSILLPRS